MAEVEEKQIENEEIIRGMTGQPIYPNALFMLPAESMTVTEVLEALVQASKVFKPVIKSAVSTVPYRYEYATLDDLVGATAEALTSNSLRIIHQTLPLDRDCWVLVTKLWHSKSGEWLAAYAPVDPEPQPSGGFSSRQEWGKQISYIRKYQMASLLNLTAESDSDASERGKQTASQGAAQGKRKQTAAEKRSWAILNTLGIDQPAWKADICKRYKVDSCTKLDNATWAKINNALVNYEKMLATISEHYQAKPEEVQSFLVYKFGHRIGESYDVLHEALNGDNGKMAALFEEFSIWKELPEGKVDGEEEEAEEAEEVLFPNTEQPERKHNPPA